MPLAKFTAASVMGDPRRHPNEDAWAADPERGAFAVCDGVTATLLEGGIYPPWAGSGRAAWLAAAALAAAPPGEPTGALTTALANADRLIGALNAARDDGPIDFYHHDAFNTTAVAAIVEPDSRATIACVGDAAALVQPADAAPELLTVFQTAGAERLRDAILSAGGMSDRERVELFRRDLRNRAEPWHGLPGLGFGVLDGTGRYLPLVEWVTLILAPGDRLYLCSDGVGRYLADLAADGIALPATVADVIEAARARPGRPPAPYADDLTVLIVANGPPSLGR